MTLIKSISGIRGTIGGQPGEGLSPVDIVKYTAAFGQWCKNNHPNQKNTIVIGRDARSSGDMVNKIICGTLMGMGIDVLDTGLTTTPTVEMAVTEKKAEGGIIITASHNPKEWNALKLLNSEGEFLSADDGNTILNIADNNNYSFVDVGKIGKYFSMNDATDMHIQKIIELDIVLKEKIQNRN